MNQRLKELRKFLKLSQTAFGAKLGVSRDVINNFENGRVELKDNFIQLICLKFSINENWLRAGKGEMCQKTTSERLDEIAKELQLTPNQTKVFHILMGLPSEKREVIANAFFLICDENDRRRNEEQAAAIQSEQAIIQKEEETTPDEENVSV